jgi:hypothetical protein
LGFFGVESGLLLFQKNVIVIQNIVDYPLLEVTIEIVDCSPFANITIHGFHIYVYAKRNSYFHQKSFYYF